MLKDVEFEFLHHSPHSLYFPKMIQSNAHLRLQKWSLETTIQDQALDEAKDTEPEKEQKKPFNVWDRRWRFNVLVIFGDLPGPFLCCDPPQNWLDVSSKVHPMQIIPFWWTFGGVCHGLSCWFLHHPILMGCLPGIVLSTWGWFYPRS